MKNQTSVDATPTKAFPENNIDMNEVYRILRTIHYLTDDDRQEVAIKVFRYGYLHEPDKHPLRAFVRMLSKQQISKWSRSRTGRNESVTEPISNFDMFEGTMNPVIDFLEDTSIDIVNGIDVKDELERVLAIINQLPPIYKEAMDDYLKGETYSSGRLYVARKLIITPMDEWVFKDLSDNKYTLVNLDTGEKTPITHLKEALEVTGASISHLHKCLNNRKVFGDDKWFIALTGEEDLTAEEQELERYYALNTDTGEKITSSRQKDISDKVKMSISAVRKSINGTGTFKESPWKVGIEKYKIGNNLK